MRVSRLVVPVLGAALLAGCGSSPQRAVTVGQPAANSPAAQTSDVPKPKSAGDPLTAAQAKAGLLSVTDMPTGWSAEANSPAITGKDKVTPASCQTMFDRIDATKGETQANAKAEASFTSGGALGTSLVMDVASFDSADQSAKVQDVVAKLTKCSKLSSTDAQGVKTTLDVTGLSFPNLGDQTMAIRVTAKRQGFTIVADLVAVATGHNLVTFSAAGLQPMPGADLEKVARAGVAKVALAAKS